jgi:hypothetical protein
MIKAAAGTLIGGVEFAVVVGTSVYWRPPHSRDRLNQDHLVK